MNTEQSLVFKSQPKEGKFSECCWLFCFIHLCCCFWTALHLFCCLGLSCVCLANNTLNRTKCLSLFTFNMERYTVASFASFPYSHQQFVCELLARIRLQDEVMLATVIS